MDPSSVSRLSEASYSGGDDHRLISIDSMASGIVSVLGARLSPIAEDIQARMEEIIDHVHYEIKSSGYEKKLIGGIVVTGGGALLKHLPQLIEYVTGLDCRVGYPNEHLAKNETLPKNVYEDLKSPMYATGIGLLIKGVEKVEAQMLKESLQQSRKSESTAEVTPKKTRGLFASLLEGTKKFIKDDISDQEYLK